MGDERKRGCIVLFGVNVRHRCIVGEVYPVLVITEKHRQARLFDDSAATSPCVCVRWQLTFIIAAPKPNYLL